MAPSDRESQDKKRRRDITTRLSILEVQQEERLAKRRAELLRLPYVNLVAFPIDSNAVSYAPREDAEKVRAVVFYKKGRDVRIGVVNPDIPAFADFVKTVAARTDVEPQVFIISNHSFSVALSRYPLLDVDAEGAEDAMNVDVKKLSEFERVMADLKQLGEHITSLKPTEVLTTIVASAARLRASDIHIEPMADTARLRYRIDGVLHDITSFALEGWQQILSRVKILSKLKLNVRDAPQEGSFVLKVAKEAYDVRVSVLPGSYGEHIVLRLFGRAAKVLALDDLGLKEHDHKLLLEELRHHTGMVVAAGPTGSGKTTTVAACINHVNKPELKIITLEDPIEYRLPGVEQTQIDTDAGYTFAVGLRSVLRQDPDIILVGEMRDTETAETAMHGAMTGHLVFTTLHANDAPSVITRLTNMGVKPFVLAPALNLIIAQRLVRKVCQYCAKEYKPTAAVREHILQAMRSVHLDVFDPARLNDPSLRFVKAAGCKECGGTGYRGRTGVFEIFTVRGDMEELLLQKIDTHQIRDAALASGATTITQDGYLKVLDKITTVEEVERISAE